MDKAHVSILRQICGVRINTPAVMVLSEAAQQPLADLWIIRTVRFWNSLAGLPATSLYKQVALADCRDAVQNNVHNWAHSFMKGLTRLVYQVVIRCDDMDFINLPRVRQLLVERFVAPLQQLDISPRTCPSRGALLCTYVRWFQRPDNVSSCPAQLHLPRRTVQRFLRFRSGCHGLTNDLGRRTGTPPCGAALWALSCGLWR